MNSNFTQIIELMPILMKQALDAELKPRDKLGKLPLKGIYIFYENGKPIYVGRTNRMRTRLQEHGRQSSTHNNAPFAFNIAKQEAGKQGIDVTRKRTDLEQDSKFRELFLSAKKRVSQMSVRVVEIDDPNTQAIFEVYASMELETPFNDFDTH